MLAWLGFLAVALGVLGYVPYILGLYKKTVTPHAFSWFVWALLTAIAFIAQVKDGAGPGAWITGVTAAFSIVFSIYGWCYGKRNITRSDWAVFMACLLAIPLWVLTKSPLWSVILITVIDALAFAPTFRKSYNKPHEEPVSTFALSGLKFVVALFALENISVITALYPASLVIMNGAFVALLIVRRKILRNA